MRKMQKIFALLLALVLAFSLGTFAMAGNETAELPPPTDAPVESAEPTDAPTESEEPEESEEPVIAPAPETTDAITILYTNDVHTYIDGDLNYASIAAMKQEYAKTGSVLLLDAGDHIQGTAYGALDKGANIIKLMNAAGYDLATLGNHEFDYGMEGAMNAIKWAEFPYVSCNFYHETDGVRGANVLDSYKIFEAGGKKIAVIGVTTPESFTKSTPAYFMDEAQSKYIYGIAGGTDGSVLYADVQKAIDAAKAEGVDYVIALGHLGDDPASDPWNSEDVIANTTGLDAFIDGHSHSTVPMKEVKDKNGDTVILTQTGSYFKAIGVMTITADGIKSELKTEFEGADESVKAIQDAWVAEVDTKLGEVIGTTDCKLDNFEGETRLVRKMETNTGDFAADALYYLFDNMGLDVDVAVMNGGGVRSGAITGELSYKTCKTIHTFGNVACLQTVTGQQLLDALEWGAKDAATDGSKECGGFLQVSGLKYTINTEIPSTVQKDEKGVWIGGPTGEYRVSKVMVLNKESGEYEPLNLEAKYNLAGYNYTLRNLGDGFAMFSGAVNVLDYVMEDYMVLANYIKSFPVDETTKLPKVTGYDELHGAGRITLIAEKPETPVEPEKPEKPEETGKVIYIVTVGDSLWKIANDQLGDGAMWKSIYENNKSIIKDPNLIYVGQELVLTK